MGNSPCYYCEKSPCKEHDTCKRYQDFRKEREAIHKKMTADYMHDAYICKAVMKCKKYQNRKKEK